MACEPFRSLRVRGPKDDATKNIFLKVKHAAMVGDGYTTFEWPIEQKKQVCTGYATLHDGHKIHLVFQESKA